MVEQRVHGTTSCEVDEDLSLCLDSGLMTGWRSLDIYCGADPNGNPALMEHFRVPKRE